MKYDILGIGNPIIDIAFRVDDSLLSKENITKGAMNLIDEDRAVRLASLAEITNKCVAGSAANTIVALSSMDIKCAFLGNIGNDDFGVFFKTEMKKIGVDFLGREDKENSTSRSIILIHDDAERSMNTYLGASGYFGVSDVKKDLLNEAKIVYGEGYLFDTKTSKMALKQAFSFAKEMGKITALTLSDSFCVKRHYLDFMELLKTRTIDILFANEKEITALFGDEWKIETKKYCKEIVVTMGKDGAMLIFRDKTIKIDAKHTDKVIDTTGAGDLFAAGYLYGVINGHPPEQRLEIGAICATEAISHYGTRPETPLKNLIYK